MPNRSFEFWWQYSKVHLIIFVYVAGLPLLYLIHWAYIPVFAWFINELFFCLCGTFSWQVRISASITSWNKNSGKNKNAFTWKSISSVKDFKYLLNIVRNSFIVLHLEEWFWNENRRKHSYRFAPLLGCTGSIPTRLQ